LRRHRQRGARSELVLFLQPVPARLYHAGIAGRIRDGTAASAKAKESAARTVPLSKASWGYAQKAGAV
jgi:hypothetical protein